MEKFISTAYWAIHMCPELKTKKQRRDWVIEYLTSPPLDPKLYKL